MRGYTWRALWVGHFGDNNINNNRGGVDGDDLNNNARLVGIAKAVLGHFLSSKESIVYPNPVPSSATALWPNPSSTMATSSLTW